MLAAAAAEPMQLEINGQVRTYQLERPAAHGPSPTIIMLHGGGTAAEREEQLSGLATLAQPEGFATVFPQGARGLWNFFPPGRESIAYAEFIERRGGHIPDDVGFLTRLRADLVQRGIADPARVYLAGRSLGGVMALRMACLDAEGFAAIAVLLSAMPDVTGADCQPPTPVPILLINGTDDRVLPYKGEHGPRGEILWSTQRLATFLRHVNGCEPPVQEPAGPLGRMHSLVIERATECSGGPVVLYRIVDGGHEIPAAFNANKTLLEFFRDKAR